MAKPRRKSRIVGGVTEWWCNTGRHFVPADGFNRNANTNSGLDQRCRECKKLYYQRNRGRIAARTKAYREGASREVILARKKRYYEANKEECNRKTREYHHANRSTLLPKKRQRYENNKEQYLASQRRYKSANRAKVLAAQMRCYFARREYYIHKSKMVRANKYSEGAFTLEQWLLKCDYWGWRCYLCGVDLKGKKLHCEHRIPLSRGGKNFLSNVAPSCPGCNCRKQDMTDREYRASALQLL